MLLAPRGRTPRNLRLGRVELQAVGFRPPCHFVKARRHVVAMHPHQTTVKSRRSACHQRRRAERVDDCSLAAAARQCTAGKGWARVRTPVARRIKLATVPIWRLKFGRAAAVRYDSNHLITVSSTPYDIRSMVGRVL
jgi:hypothetical protein